MKRRQFTALAAAASLMPLAHAQADKTLKVLVGFPPGGSIDIVSRVLRTGPARAGAWRPIC
jgi:tripartite-type tricarboxylate transporter receptor subunit TctC